MIPKNNLETMALRFAELTRYAAEPAKVVRASIDFDRGFASLIHDRDGKDVAEQFKWDGHAWNLVQSS